MVKFNEFTKFIESISRLLLAALVFASFAFTPSAFSVEGDRPTFIEELGLIDDSSKMMERKWLSEVSLAESRWIAEYEGLKTSEEVGAYQRSRLDAFRASLGRMWSRTPLNGRVTGRGEGKSFRWENVLFESQPGVYVTGLLFLPLEERFQAPYPALIVACGHANEAKGFSEYQGAGILAASNGVAAFVVDPIDQGERFQYVDEEGTPRLTSVAAHNMTHAGSILVGRSAATFEVWDLMRSIDYLLSRDEIDGSKIGVCGVSGGGTQTSYLMNLDERVSLGAPGCYICSFFGDLTSTLGPQDGEQNIWGQLKFGMDHADYLFLRAPMPTLMCCVTKDFFKVSDSWKSYRYASRIYSRLGRPERLAIIESDSEHGFTEEARAATVRWARRWFLGRDDELDESPQPLLEGAELLSMKSGKGISSASGFRTSRDLNLDLADEFEGSRRAKWSTITTAAAAALVRARAVVRPDASSPCATVVGTREWNGYVERVLETDEQVWLTTRENFGAQERFDSMTLIIGDKGRYSASTTSRFERAASGERIAAVELRGYGDTQGIGRDYYDYSQFGLDGSENCYAYLLGQTYVGLRVDDLLAVAKSYRQEYGVKELRLVAEDWAGTVALVAAIASPETFASVELVGELPTWREQLGREYGPIPLTNTIHGVLEDFDIDDLKGFLGERLKESR